MQPEQIAALCEKIKQNIARVVVGKEDMIELMLAAVLARGHVLLEDVPGTGKTVTAASLAKSIGGQFSRIQFTPDLLPSDITGTRVYRPDQGEFVFHPGPVFANILLADEINRATPRTQSALLECMEERQVTDGGVSYPMPTPFLVIATKADKISRGARMKNLAPICRALQVQPWQVIPFSSQDGTGRDAVLNLIETTCYAEEILDESADDSPK